MKNCNCSCHTAGEWQKDFDKWFGYREGSKRRFAYATGVFDEVKAYIHELLQKKEAEHEDKLMRFAFYKEHKEKKLERQHRAQICQLLKPQYPKAQSDTEHKSNMKAIDWFVEQQKSILQSIHGEK